MPTVNTAPTALTTTAINYALAGATTGAAYRVLDRLESSNLDGDALTQRAVNVRSCVKVFGPMAAVYPRDFKAGAFSTGTPSLLIPGASVTFELLENCDRVQFMYQLSWQGLIASPQEDVLLLDPDNDPQVAELYIRLDDRHAIWETPHKAPYSVSRLTWGGSRRKAEPYMRVGSAPNWDVDPARQRTLSGFISLGSLQAGVHHVGLAVWYRGAGAVRVRSSQVAVIARYR
jgi:hypothetical protein